MPTTIPITFSANTVPVGVKAVNINDLLTIISEYMTGQISQDVSFFIQGASAPAYNAGLFFNTTTQRFETWNGSGYIPISELQVGDMKVALRSSDDTANGWVLLNGRPINNILTLTQIQRNNLNTLFASGALPNYTFLSGLSGLPSSGSFSSIVNNAINPTTGTIGALTIGSSYSQSEIQAFRDNTEMLLSSTVNLQTATANIQSVAEQLLTSLNSSSAVIGPRWFVFCGYPS